MNVAWCYEVCTACDLRVLKVPMGSWITISRLDAEDHLNAASLLGMARLRGQGNEHFDFSKEIICECSAVGSEITLTVGENTLVIHDPCPLVGAGDHRIGILTSDSQFLLRKLALSQRHAPLVVPVCLG